MQQSIVKFLALSYRYCSTCLGQYNAHHQEPVKFDGLLMMGIVMPETCWAVSLRQGNTFYDWLLHLVGCFIRVFEHSLSRRAAADPRLRPCSHRDRHCFNKLHKSSALKNTHRKVCITTLSQLPWRALNFFAHQKRKDITEWKLNSLVRRIELYALTQDMLGRRGENQRYSLITLLLSFKFRVVWNFLRCG